MIPRKSHKTIGYLISLLVSFIWAVDRYLSTGNPPRDPETVLDRLYQSHLHQACQSYFTHFSESPGDPTSLTDQIHLTIGSGPDSLMAGIWRLKDRDLDPLPMIFEMTESDSLIGGLKFGKPEEPPEFLDSWGNPYHVLLDDNGDGQLIHPLIKKVHPETRFLIWSCGPDGKTGTLETEKDDRYHSYPR